MGGSRRKLKRSRAKVRVGLPSKKPREFKPAFDLPEALAGGGEPRWDAEGSVVKNYSAFGVVANPNLLGAHSRGTPRLVQSAELQAPDIDAARAPVDEFEPVDTGSDLENDDLKSALGKKRRDGKSAPLEPLTKIQRVYIGRLIEKYGDNYKAMFMDTKLNAMQHSVGTLKKLCERYHNYGAQIMRCSFCEAMPKRELIVTHGVLLRVRWRRRMPPMWRLSLRRRRRLSKGRGDAPG